MKLIFCLLVTLSAVSAVGQSAAEWSEYKQANGIDPRYTYDAWVKAGMPHSGSVSGNSGSGNSGPSADQIAEQKADLAEQKAAAAQKIIQGEADALTQQGRDAFNRQDYETAIKYFQAALEKTPDDSTISNWILKNKAAITGKKQREQEAFNRSKQEGLSQLRGLSQGGNFDSGTGLKSINSTDSGLKGLDDNSTGLKTLPNVITDPMVVDARNVPTGLPKEVEDSIPHTPAGNWVRKGFQAIQAHDWKSALADFQTAQLNESGDPGLARLVDLAQYTLQRESQTTNAKPTAKDADLIKQSLGNYQDFVSRHPELGNKLSDWNFLHEDKENPAWAKFFETIRSWLPTSDKVNPSEKPKSNAVGIRG